MNKRPFKSRIIVPHNKDCFMKGRKHQWSGIIDGSFFGNFAANENTRHGNYVYWHKVTCNDPDCKAIKAVDSFVLADAE